jgi:hypothetical protein
MIKECDPQPVFASYERDVYSPETREHRRSTGSEMFPHLRPLRSSGARVRYRPASYKHLAPPEPRLVRQVS